uniref:Aminophospholipid ATPase n=1 Tax=Arundo donax TaxID=35708 RepID=A0A0A9FTY0_ARUDO
MKNQGKSHMKQSLPMRRPLLLQHGNSVSRFTNGHIQVLLCMS